MSADGHATDLAVRMAALDRDLAEVERRLDALLRCPGPVGAVPPARSPRSSRGSWRRG